MKTTVILSEAGDPWPKGGVGCIKCRYIKLTTGALSRFMEARCAMVRQPPARAQSRFSAQAPELERREEYEMVKFPWTRVYVR
jgi:hypothetical protein